MGGGVGCSFCVTAGWGGVVVAVMSCCVKSNPDDASIKRCRRMQKCFEPPEETSVEILILL